MYIINYRPALHHPVYKGGYYFVVFWALLDLIMSVRHYALYDGFTPAIFHLFVVLAIVLPLLKRTISVSLRKAIYTSNIPYEIRKVEFDNPRFSIMNNRKIGSISIITSNGVFNTNFEGPIDKITTVIDELSKSSSFSQ